MAELHFYDFDGTLFKSPHEPAVWDGDWWNAAESLLPPCVPERPGSDWWISDTLSSAKRSISDPDVYAVLATGRPERSGLRYRVPELLKTQGLRFDEVHLAPPSGTLAWKKGLIAKMLQKYPFIKVVKIWDDRISHLPEFKTVALRMGILKDNIFLTHVRARSKEPECGEPDSVQVDLEKTVTPKYLGLFLDARSKADLSHAFPYAHQNLESDHITLQFRPQMTPELTQMIGTRGRAKVVGYVENEKAQAVVVELLHGLVRPDGKAPHVTISLADGVEASYSNELIAKNPIQPVSPFMVSGFIDVSPRSLSPARVAARWLESASQTMDLDKPRLP